MKGQFIRPLPLNSWDFKSYLWSTGGCGYSPDQEQLGTKGVLEKTTAPPSASLLQGAPKRAVSDETDPDSGTERLWEE